MGRRRAPIPLDLFETAEFLTQYENKELKWDGLVGQKQDELWEVHSVLVQILTHFCQLLLELGISRELFPVEREKSY